jgi:ATP-binding cassette subfamily B protein
MQGRSKATLKEVSLKRVLSLFNGYWGQLSVILVLALAAAVIGLVPPLVMKWIIDSALPQGNMRMLLEYVTLLATMPLLSGLLGVWQNHLNTKVGQGVMRDLRESLFLNLQRQAMSFFTHSKAGEIIQRITGDVQAVQAVVTSLVVQTITNFVIVLTTIGILFALDWRLAVLSTLLLPIFILPVRKVSKVRRKLRNEAQRVRGEMSAQLGEIFGVSGAMLTRIFQREPMQQAQFHELNGRVMDLELRSNLVGRWFGMFITLLGPLGAALIYLYGGYSVLQGTMTIGGIVAFAAYLGRLYGPVGSLLNLQVEVATALGVFVRIFEYEDMKPEIEDAEGAIELPAVSGAVAFEDVSFAYEQGQYALRDVSFSVSPGQLLAVVGPSGAGKSTMIGMLARLYDPTEGRVTFDGYDLRHVTVNSVRSQVAFVTQESFLFHATIRDNLLFAKQDATQEEMESACRQAYIHDMISGLPDGYDTMVGERGHRLSGGERQRIAIARAILKNPRILVLDEATSHLDSESEAYVQAALEQLMKGRTTIVIAHRLSTVLAADKIVALEAGTVVEQGAHLELLEKDGLYARLYHTQFAKAEELRAQQEPMHAHHPRQRHRQRH